MISCEDAAESPPIPPCAWRDTLGVRPNSGSASSLNTTFAPPGKPGNGQSRRRSNRGPRPRRRRGAHLSARSSPDRSLGTAPQGINHNRPRFPQLHVSLRSLPRVGHFPAKRARRIPEGNFPICPPKGNYAGSGPAGTILVGCSGSLNMPPRLVGSGDIGVPCKW